MKINNLNLVCVGNSHMASFSKALNNRLSDTEDKTLKFWPDSQMEFSWDNFRTNNFLSSPKFKANNPLGLKNEDLIEKKYILVLVGLELSGNSIFKHFGNLAYANPAKLQNGYSCSPLMPYVHGKMINTLEIAAHLEKRTAPTYSIDMCKNMFEDSILRFLNKLLQLLKNSTFQNVYCVPAPNMPEMVARWRLGENYCNSGCQRVINNVYRKILEQLISKTETQQNVILHNTDFENKLGFIINKFANSVALNNNHVNPLYYEHIVSELIDRIAKIENNPDKENFNFVSKQPI